MHGPYSILLRDWLTGLKLDSVGRRLDDLGGHGRIQIEYKWTLLGKKFFAFLPAVALHTVTRHAESPGCYGRFGIQNCIRIKNTMQKRNFNVSDFSIHASQLKSDKIHLCFVKGGSTNGILSFLLSPVFFSNIKPWTNITNTTASFIWSKCQSYCEY